MKIHFCWFEASGKKKLKLVGINSRRYFQSFATKCISRDAWQARARVVLTPKLIASFPSEKEFVNWSIVLDQSSVTAKSMLVTQSAKKIIIYVHISLNFWTQTLILEQCSLFSHIF